MQLEPLIWKLAFIKNALMEIHIIPKPNEKGWFANLWDINQKLTKKVPTILELQKMLTGLVPARISEDHILHVSTPSKDLIPIRDYKIEVATSNIPVPRIRSLEDNYRINLDKKSPNPKSEASEKSKKRKKTELKKKPAKKSKKQRKTSSEASEDDVDKSEPIPEPPTQYDHDSSSEDDSPDRQAIILGSSSSEDEDFI